MRLSQALFRFSVPAVADHRREVQVIAQQHLARAYAHSQRAPQDQTWFQVINKLTHWLDRLRAADENRVGRAEDGSYASTDCFIPMTPSASSIPAASPTAA